MTYQNDYHLADKMQKQFRGRGQGVSGMQASSTSELMRRAKMGKDPNVNCSEQAFRDSYRSRQSRTYSAAADTADASGAAYRRRTAAYTAENTARNTRYKKNSMPYGRYAHKDTQQPVSEERYGSSAEIRVKQKAFPPMFIALLLLGTVMIMFLVFSISEVYQTTNEIARLEDELEVLQSEADELKLRLEEKNDVRRIEEIATAKLGMVKEDSLQRRYVSLSDGEYIELVADETQTEDTTGGVMLSSIFSSLGHFFERFR